MIKVLQVYPQMNNAGTEMVIMNLYKNINLKNIRFDFLVQEKGTRDNEIVKLGGHIHQIKNDNEKKYYQQLLEFFKNNDFQVIHTHTHKEMGLVLKAAAKSGIEIRVAHSHNARQDLPKFMHLYKYITSRNIEKYATHYFACSKEAAKWLFPRKYMHFKFIPNGIDSKKFQFSIEKRLGVRKELGLKETDFVVGHVGRLAEQKNHKYLINIAKNIKNKNIKFICVGEGPLLNDLNEIIQINNLDNNFKLLGARTDTDKIYCAFDCFVLPSLHEGLGIVAIEAQASGLPCLLSTNVPKEADIKADLCEFLPIGDNDFQIWSNRIDCIYKKRDIRNRAELYRYIYQTKYDIRYSAKMLENFYKNAEG